MAITTIATTDSPETGRTAINANFQDVLGAFGGSTTAFPKRYVALLSQSGTSAPVATVLENTLGGTVVWSYNGVGDYRATLASVFTANKTFLSVHLDDAMLSDIERVAYLSWVSTSVVALANASETFAPVNGVGRAYVSMVVYP